MLNLRIFVETHPESLQMAEYSSYTIFQSFLSIVLFSHLFDNILLNVFLGKGSVIHLMIPTIKTTTKRLVVTFEASIVFYFVVTALKRVCTLVASKIDLEQYPINSTKGAGFKSLILKYEAKEKDCRSVE